MPRRITEPFRTSVERATEWWADRKVGQDPAARIAINLRPIRSPWGGGNQWAAQLTRSLRQSGYSVRYDLRRPVDCILLADPRQTGTVTFGTEDIRAYLDRHPETVCIHRVNENDRHRNTDFMDSLLAEANQTADHTVFISGWLRDYHAANWFDDNEPHSVILNGADPRLYHPIGGNAFRPGGPMRLVTHHWSDNWLKGFSVYQEIDALIAGGSLPGIELWVIGRWPGEIRWRAARTYGPMAGAELAGLLRSCHVYVTGSLWEPGGMHFIEGAQCGLPVLYHMDGGGIVEVARDFGVGFRDDVRSAILEIRERYFELREQVLQRAPSGDRMCVEYRQTIQRTIVRKKGSE